VTDHSVFISSCSRRQLARRRARLGLWQLFPRPRQFLRRRPRREPVIGARYTDLRRI